MKRILLLLADGFEAYEAAAFTDVFGWADEYGEETFEIVTAGLRERLRCTFALEVIPHKLLAELDLEPFDALAIPGGFEKAGFYNDAYSLEFGRTIRDFAERGKPIAAVCVGALCVAHSGVLRGRRATTYHLLQGRRRAELAELGAEVIDAPIVADGNIITSSAPSTAIEVAFALLECLTSTENVEHIKHLMGFDPTS